MQIVFKIKTDIDLLYKIVIDNILYFSYIYGNKNNSNKYYSIWINYLFILELSFGVSLFTSGLIGSSVLPNT